MVNLTLPVRSKVGKGKYHKLQNTVKNVKRIQVYRWNPDDKENPRIDTYEIDLQNCGPKVLDALIKIKDPDEYFQKLVIHSNLTYKDYLSYACI